MDPAPTRTILVVDDEVPIRLALTRVLGEGGYTVLGTDSGREALELFQQHPIDLVISDHYMPEMSGIDLLKLVRVRHPHVVRILLTGDKRPRAWRARRRRAARFEVPPSAGCPDP